jgi:hypothetical protein
LPPAEGVFEESYVSTDGQSSGSSAKPSTTGEKAGSFFGRLMRKTESTASSTFGTAKKYGGKAVAAVDKAISFSEKLRQLCEATGAPPEVQQAMMAAFSDVIGRSTLNAIEAAIPGWSLVKGGLDFASECDHLISIVRERARLERRIERDYFRSQGPTKAIEGLLKLMERDVASSSARTATSGARFTAAVAGAATATPAALESIVGAVTAVVDVMRQCAEIALEVRDMVEGNRLIEEHFSNGAALQDVFRNAFIGTFIVAKAPEPYLMNVSLTLYAEPGSITCLKKMASVIREAKERAEGYLEDSGLTLEPPLEEAEQHGAFMQVSQLVQHATLMSEIRAGKSLRPTPVIPRPVFPDPEPEPPPVDPPPPVPIQIVVGDIQDSTPDVGPALDRLEAILRRVAADYEETFSRYFFKALRNTSTESMATFTYLKEQLAADIRQSKLNRDIITVPSIIRAVLGGPPSLEAARQAAGARDIHSPALLSLMVLKSSSDLYGLLAKAFGQWELAESDVIGFFKTSR